MLSTWDPKYASEPVINCMLATTAAPTFFPPVQVGDQTLVDGAVGCNNPTALALDVCDIHSDFSNLQCLVTAGMGLGSVGLDSRPRGFSGLWKMIGAMQGLTTDDSEVHASVMHRFRQQPEKYVYLAAPESVASVEFTEWKKVPGIMQETLKLALTKERLDQLGDCTRTLAK